MTRRWTRKQASALAQRLQQLDGASAVREKRSKYGAQRTQAYGHTFASKGEAMRYIELRQMERAGLIQQLELQVSYELVPAVVIGGKKTQPIRYVCDFRYLEGGVLVVEDFKGVRTKEYLIKRALMRHVHGIEIRETGRQT